MDAVLAAIEPALAQDAAAAAPAAAGPASNPYGLAHIIERHNPVQMGILSIQWAYDILTGAATPDCAIVDTGVTVVTLENLNDYTK